LDTASSRRGWRSSGLPAVRREAVYRAAGQSALYGFSAFSAGMVCGGIWALLRVGSYWIWTPKEIWSVIVWIYFAALTHLKFIPAQDGWPGGPGASRWAPPPPGTSSCCSRSSASACCCAAPTPSDWRSGVSSPPSRRARGWVLRSASPGPPAPSSWAGTRAVRRHGRTRLRRLVRAERDGRPRPHAVLYGLLLSTGLLAVNAACCTAERLVQILPGNGHGAAPPPHVMHLASWASSSPTWRARCTATGSRAWRSRRVDSRGWGRPGGSSGWTGSTP